MFASMLYEQHDGEKQNKTTVDWNGQWKLDWNPQMAIVRYWKVNR